jgi:hypothetical protein
MPSRDQKLTGSAGEHFVCSTLAQLDWAASLTREGVARADILAVRADATLRAQLLGAGFPPLDEDDVRGIRVTTLLMTGQRSPTVLLRLTEHLQRLLPHAERVEIAGASHAMQEENPGAVNQAILGFLARHSSQRNVDSHRRPLPHSSEHDSSATTHDGRPPPRLSFPLGVDNEMMNWPLCPTPSTA